MKNLPFIISILFTFLTVVLKGQNIPFRVGELLIYNAEFNYIPVGEAVLQVHGMDTINNYPSYHVSFSAHTGKLADQIFKIRDRVDIWLDKTKLYTHKMRKKIREGPYKKRTHMIVDYDNMIAITNQDTSKINFEVRDPYSMFYYLRTIPLEVNKPMSFSTYENRKNTEFDLVVTGKEIVNVPFGSYICKVVKPYKKGRTLFKNQGDMQIWFTDDKERLPLKIQIKLKYGSMTLYLRQVNL